MLTSKHKQGIFFTKKDMNCLKNSPFRLPSLAPWVSKSRYNFNEKTKCTCALQLLYKAGVITERCSTLAPCYAYWESQTCNKLTSDRKQESDFQCLGKVINIIYASLFISKMEGSNSLSMWTVPVINNQIQYDTKENRADLSVDQMTKILIKPSH